MQGPPKLHRDLRKYTENSETIRDFRNYTGTSETIQGPPKVYTGLPKLYRDFQNYTGISKNYTQLSQVQTYEITQISEFTDTSAATNRPRNLHQKTIQRPSNVYTDFQNYKKALHSSTEPLRICTKTSKTTRRSQNLHRDLRKYIKTFKTTLRPPKLHRDYRIYADTFETTKTYCQSLYLPSDAQESCF